MTSTTAASVGLQLLDALKSADDIRLQNADDGRVIAEHIMASPCSIVVLYGPAKANTKEFIQQWVVPLLSERWSVFHRLRGESSSLPVASAPALPRLEIWDGFENYLVDDTPHLELLHELAESSRDRSVADKYVLLLQEDYLNRIFQLGSKVPHILDDLFEIPSMSGKGFLDALERAAARHNVQLADSFRSALARDLDPIRTKTIVGPELVAIIVFELLRNTRGQALKVSADDYVSMGGLAGLLEAHIDFLLENLPDEIDGAIGWAVLEEVLRTPVGVAEDLSDIAVRFDVPPTIPLQVLAWLEADRDVLRPNTQGGHDLVPGVLVMGVQNRGKTTGGGPRSCRLSAPPGCQAVRRVWRAVAAPELQEDQRATQRPACR